jgi:nucleoside-diphosphate-sugar epimerase
MYDILLTGSSGFLGSYLLKSLQQNNKVVTLNRSSGDILIDLSKSTFDFNKVFDVVVHSAGNIHANPKSDLERNKVYFDNYNSTVNLIKSLAVPPSYFVFISSISVYGLEEGVNISEGAPLLALDSYGKSKIDSENYLINWCKYNNVKLLILRLPLVVGNSPKGNLKKMINAIRNYYYFEVSGGTARRSMVLAEDVAANLLHMINYPGIYNLSDGFHPSYHELSSAYSKLLRKRVIFSISFRLADFLAKIGDKLFPFNIYNSKVLKKLLSTLIIDDSLARKTFGWNSHNVVDNIGL